MSVSGIVSVVPTALKHAQYIGRGGATLAVASSAASLAAPCFQVIGGGHDGKPGGHLAQLSPIAKSVLYMAFGMALHYLGYSFARSITIALFTSKSTGYPEVPGAFPFAMAFVSPMSLFLLFRYGKMLEKSGPRGALKRSTFLCATILLCAGISTAALEKSDVKWVGIPALKFLTGPLFVFRESYVQLLTSQYWSFLASVLTPDQSARWFAPIAGLTSMSSAIGGLAVSSLTNTVGLPGTLSLAGLALMSSILATEAAYSVAESRGFAPSGQNPKKTNHDGTSETKGHTDQTILGKAKKLFARVPVLRALFVEILASQGLATLLNVCFVQSLGSSIQDDSVRAGWVGRFYALINIISMVLQFGCLPILMQVIEPRQLWRIIPLISLGFTSFQAFQESPTLYIVSGSLLVMKVLEYSARRMLDEMVYVPLDFESRFIGKEIIGVFGFRFGKSLMSLLLSALTTACGHFSLQQLSILSDAAALLWAKAAWDLSNLVPTREEARTAYVDSRSGQRK